MQGTILNGSLVGLKCVSHQPHPTTPSRRASTGARPSNSPPPPTDPPYRPLRPPARPPPTAPTRPLRRVPKILEAKPRVAQRHLYGNFCRPFLALKVS